MGLSKKEKNDNLKYPINEQIKRIYNQIEELILKYGCYWDFGPNKTNESIVLSFLAVLLDEDNISSYKYLYKKEMSSRRWVSPLSKLRKEEKTYKSFKISWQKISNSLEMYSILQQELDKLESTFRGKKTKAELLQKEAELRAEKRGLNKNKPILDFVKKVFKSN